MSALTRVLHHDEPSPPARAVPPEAVAELPEAPEAEALDAFRADVAARPAPTFAMLTVGRSGPDEITITGKHGDDALGMPTRTVGRPRLALGGLVGGDDSEPPEVVRLYLSEWSRTATELREWVERLRAEVGDAELRLVVWDDSGYEVPWEVLYLWGDRAANRRPGWLGELVTVTRMLTTHPGDPSEQWSPLDLGEHACQGDTLAYVHRDMTDDLVPLGPFEPDEVTAEGLLDRLADTDQPVAMVYLAQHGEFAERLTGLALGELGWSHFAYAGLPALMRSHGLVFLNACHSGRMTNDPRINASLFGFAEMFLRKGAASVVGTLGKVETTLARRVAAELLAEISGESGIPLAEALRRVRAAAAAGVAGFNPTESAVKRFVYTFMYVCYGNPYTTLRLPGGDHG